MFSPSTAPRWKRQTKTGRQQAAWGGKGSYELKAARARNNGSRPKLNKARPPDFTNTLLVIDICLSSDRCRPLPPSAALLLLKLRSAYCEADGQGTRLRGIADSCQVTSQHLLRVLGHRPTQDLLVDHADQLVGGHRPRRTDHELERGLYLGAHVRRRPEVGAVKYGPQHLTHVTARALPRRHGVVHAAVRRIVVHESLAQFPAHVVHRGGMVGQE